MKPFRTHTEQILILKDRGLTINDQKALKILEEENYYSLINGYKDLFLFKDSNNNYITPEQYKTGASFDEIYALYCFDRELRSILLEKLLKFESNIKSKISYRFSEKYHEANAYLNMLNYSRDPNDLKIILKLIAIISNEISRQAYKNNPIAHYLDNHEGVPLWVLVKYLTLGNIQNFYMCIDDSTKNKIAKDFAISYKTNYNISTHFTPNMLINILKTSTLFRNVCAHEERLYNFKLYKPSQSADISAAINIPINLLDSGNLFTMVSFLKLVISKEDYMLLINNLYALHTNYKNKFSSITINDIFKSMGFNNDWFNLLN